MTRIYLHTGANLGDRLANLRAANRLIGERIGRITCYSRVYRTEAWGMTDQPDFLNQALEVETNLSPEELLSAIHQIESDLGRQRVIKWGARLIDIDILFYGNEVIRTRRLSIPHPELQHRNFVLRPLLEIAPELVHPVLGQTIAELAAESADTLTVEVLTGREVD